MQTKLIALTFITLSYSVSNAQLQHIYTPFIKNYTTKDYDGQPDNFAGIEDNRGFMYFGNLWGILEFDGKNWRNIYFPNSSTGISFAKDKEGQIYCGGRGEFGFLSPDSTGLLQYKSLTHLIEQKVSFNEIWSIHCTGSYVLFCSAEAFFLLKENKIKVIKAQTRFHPAFLAHREVYYVEQGKGLYKFAGDIPVLMPGGEYFKDKSITGILPVKHGKLYLLDNHDLYCYDTANIVKMQQEGDKLLKQTDIYTALVLNDSSYMIATNSKGLFIIDQNAKLKQTFSTSTGLTSNEVLNACVDSKGNIWVMNRKGISKIEMNQCFSYINDKHGVNGLSYTSYLYQGYYYFGTSEGLYCKNIEALSPGDGDKSFEKIVLPDGNVRSIQQIGGELFCGHDKGAYIITKNTVQHIPKTMGVWCFIQPKGFNNLILAGTYTGIVILERKHGQWCSKGYVKGFNESTRYLVQDKFENFWVSHGNKGVFKLSLSHSLDTVLKTRSYTIEDGIQSMTSNVVYNYKNDILIVNNRGFHCYTDSSDSFYAWDKLNASLGHFYSIQKFFIDPEGAFWVILHHEKILRIKQNQEGAYYVDLVIRNFRKLLAGSFEHIEAIDANTMVFGTLNGYAFFDLKKYKQNSKQQNQMFNSYIRKVELAGGSGNKIIADNSLGPKGKAEPKWAFNYKQNTVKFTFTSNCFENIEHVEYRYKLEGFDKNWSIWLNDNQKEYTNLSPGQYTFRVYSRDSYNRESQQAMFSFTILPPWFNSWYAYIVYVLLALTGGFGIYKYIQYRFRLQKKWLELSKERELWRLNKQHTDEKIQKENEILKLSNEKLSTELANLEQQDWLRLKDEQLKAEQKRAAEEQIKHEKEKHKIEISYKNKELSVLAMQIVQKKDSITKIKDYLIDYKKGNRTKDVTTLSSHLFQFIEEDSQRDKEWEDFQEHFNLVHTSFLKRLKDTYPDITPTLLKLCAYLRVKMSNKQIARLMNKTVDSVIKSRYRLRKILNLKTDDSLDSFMENF